MNSLFSSALAKFDEYNSGDPNTETIDGAAVARELVYAKRMSDRLAKFAPNASEEVRLAARCQHIGRWQIPRTTFAADRKGYLQWRNKLKDYHATLAEGILRESGYGKDVIEKVKFLILKKDLQHNQDSQLLEDVVCLVFIEFYLEDFAMRHEQQKVIDILRKTMKKMSAEARAAAGQLSLTEGIANLLATAANQR